MSRSIRIRALLVLLSLLLAFGAFFVASPESAEDIFETLGLSDDKEEQAEHEAAQEEARRKLDEAQRAFDAGDYKTAFHGANALVKQGSLDAFELFEKAKEAFRAKNADATGPIDLRELDGRKQPIHTLDQRNRYMAAQALYDAAEYEAAEYEAAFAIWLELANAGHAAGQLQISYMYLLGEGVKTNLEMSEAYLERSSNQGYLPALRRMRSRKFHEAVFQEPSYIKDAASLLKDAASALTENDDEDFMWGMMSAIYGDHSGYRYVAFFHCFGEGARKDPVLADIWTYMAYPAKEDFLTRMCHNDVEFFASYYEAIKERAEAMSKAYDIPIGRTPLSDLPPAPSGR